MSEPSRSKDVNSDRVAEVVRNVVIRRDAGEDLSDAVVLAEHPDLNPRLQGRLDVVRQIERAWRLAETPLADRSPGSGRDWLSEGSSPLPAPDTFPGYQILRILGTTHLSVVYEAVQLNGKRKVALKVLRDGAMDEACARRRFERQVDIMAGFDHPNIVTFHYSGVGNGRPYLVMQYIRGKHLDDYVRDQGLRPRETLALFRTVCEAMGYAHVHCVTHRDVKPNNILVDDEGKPYVIDFGLAKVAVSGNPADSMSDQIMGTLPYMAPEQAAGRPDQVTTRTDVYALGVVLYELLTGQRPYDVQGGTYDALRTIQETQPPPPSKTNPTLKRERDYRDIDAIVMKALEKDKGHRYATAAEFARDIDDHLNGEFVGPPGPQRLFFLIFKALRRHVFPICVAALLIIIAGSFSIIFVFAYVRTQIAQQEYEKQAARIGEYRATAESAVALRLATAVQARQVTLDAFLELWHAGLIDDARRIGPPIQERFREGAAVAFLLDDRPLSTKAHWFRQKLGESPGSFADYVIAEHELRDGNRGPALGGFQAVVESLKRSATTQPLDLLSAEGVAQRWLHDRSERRIEQLVAEPAVPTVSPSRKE